MRKNKQLEYQSPQSAESKRPSVIIPILMLIAISAFFVWGSKVNGFQLFETPIVGSINAVVPESSTPDAQVTQTLEIEVSLQQAAAPSMQDTFEQQIDTIQDALFATLATAGGKWAINEWVIDSIKYNDMETQALIWLASIDPETQMVRASEPLRAYAVKSPDGRFWSILLDDDPGFAKTISISDLREVDVVSKSGPESIIEADEPRIYGGYFLPWRAGLRKSLTWSVAHTSCTPTYYCTHAFDFADGTMFELVAAKAGIMYRWKDSCENGDSTCTNSVTLQDRSTTPWTYQIYLHIAKSSVPAELKTLGTAVNQGQKIALVDDTGYSTGHHVHFMVVAQDTLYLTSSGYYFGRAEDITFRDVSINYDEATQGGRPRLAYEAATYGGVGQTTYVSGNAAMVHKLIFPLFFYTSQR